MIKIAITKGRIEKQVCKLLKESGFDMDPIINKDRELLNRYLQKSKKFIVVSSSNQENFKNILQYQTVMAPDILFLDSREFNQRSIEGKLMNNEEAKNKLIQFLSYMYS